MILLSTSRLAFHDASFGMLPVSSHRWIDPVRKRSKNIAPSGYARSLSCGRGFQSRLERFKKDSLHLSTAHDHSQKNDKRNSFNIQRLTQPMNCFFSFLLREIGTTPITSASATGQ